MHYFSNYFFDKELCMFWTDLLSIIRSLNTVYTATGMLVMLTASEVRMEQSQTVNISSMTNTFCCVQSVTTPDDGQ
jgi:hypothetical protein